MYKVDNVELTEEQVVKLVEQYEENKKYPKWFKSNLNKSIWKFNNLNDAECVKAGISDTVGETCFFERIPHTDKSCWTEVPEPSFWDLVEDKQPIYCWNKGLSVVVCFADVKNKCTFYVDGERNGLEYENYSITYPKEYVEEMKKKLED